MKDTLGGNNLPFLLSARRVNQLYKEFGNETDRLREVYGISAEDGDPAFSPDSIDEWAKVPAVAVTWEPSIIFTCLDPTGCGGSEVGIASVIFRNGKAHVSFLPYNPRYIIVCAIGPLTSRQRALPFTQQVTRNQG